MVKKTTNLQFQEAQQTKTSRSGKKEKGKEKKNTFRYITILKAARQVRNITKKQAQEGQSGLTFRKNVSQKSLELPL